MKQKFSILKKHINVSHETLEKLVIYFELLSFWQKKMNLVSNNSLENAETRHFLDSAQLYIFCKNLNFTKFAIFPVNFFVFRLDFDENLSELQEIARRYCKIVLFQKNMILE